jgi:DNA-binding transcriptional LysR family regulator
MKGKQEKGKEGTMDLLQLKYFQTVARLEHMTQAAHELSIAQPSLSQMIARLEEELGVLLFDRQGRQIRLNQYGRALLRHVDCIFGDLEEAKQEIADLAGIEHGCIALAIVIPSLLPDLLRAFLADYPNVTFRLFHQHSSQAVLQQLEQGEIDLCITSPPIEQPDIHWITLIKDEIYLMVPPQHRLAKRQSIDLREVKHEPFISLKPGHTMRSQTDSFCQQAGFTPKVAFEGDDSSTMRSLITQGIGVGFASDLMLRAASNLAVSVALPIKEPSCHRIIGLAWRKDHYLSLAAQQFRGFIIHYFKKMLSERGV